MREPLTGPERLALKATVVRWERDRRPAEARKLADAFGALMSERDRLAEQVNTEKAGAIDARVHRAFADADVEGLDLNAMTVQELTKLVMGAIRSEATS